MRETTSIDPLPIMNRHLKESTILRSTPGQRSTVAVRLAFILASALLTAMCEGHPHDGAHVHGAGNLSIAFDSASSTAGSMELKLAAEDFFAVPENDKLDFASQDWSEWSSEGQPGIGFDQEAACRTTIQSIEESGASGNHKDVLILYTFDCKTVPSTLSVDLSVYNLDSLYVKLLNDQGQRALELPGKGVELDLKDE